MRFAEQSGDQSRSCLGFEGQQFPGSLLWIPLVEEGEERNVRQMLETGGVVGHAVGVAREVLSQVAVAVDPLVIAREPTQSRRRTCRGDRALSHLRDRWRVVREVLNGRVADVVGVRHEVDLR